MTNYADLDSLESYLSEVMKLKSRGLIVVALVLVIRALASFERDVLVL